MVQACGKRLCFGGFNRRDISGVNLFEINLLSDFICSSIGVRDDDSAFIRGGLVVAIFATT
jgi:hypothetical protein